MRRCSLRWENALRREGFRGVAGVDEAGRGPLAGPVVAAAVMLPERFRHGLLDDSKKLSPGAREQIYTELVENPQVVWSVGMGTVEEIGGVNILRATWLAMGRALDGLRTAAGVALVDGLEAGGLPVPQRALVGGDGLSLSIAAASVIAKVERDRLMCQMAEAFPVYGFEQHKGYGTRLHLERLRKHGPCPIHRQTFQPVAQLAMDLGV